MDKMLEIITGARSNEDLKINIESPEGINARIKPDGSKKELKDSEMKLPSYLQKPKFD